MPTLPREPYGRKPCQGNMPPFIKGLKLCELFYEEAVRPFLAARFPGLVYSAGHLGRGSDVLGFDTPQSADHHWGPKVTLYVSEADERQYREQIVETLAWSLPLEIHGYPTNFADVETDGGWLQPVDKPPVSHGVTVTTVESFFREYIGFNPVEPIGEKAWLAVPPQRLRTIASGAVFHDGLKQLEAARRALRWYPKDVWRYLLANAWQRVNQEEPFMARCGDVGDELGSRVVAARQVNELMRLCFLIERVYPPYYKWFGSAFARLDCAEKLSPVFHRVFDSTNWKERESQLSQAYVIIAGMQNSLGLARPVEPTLTTFYGRPYTVLFSGRYVDALHESIESETIKALPRNVGAIWQFADSTDVLDYVERWKPLTAIYESGD